MGNGSQASADPSIVSMELICARHGIQRMVELFEDLGPANYAAWKAELVVHLKANDALKQLVVGAVVDSSEEIKIPYLEGQNDK